MPKSKDHADAEEMTLLADFRRRDETTFCGFAYCPETPSVRFAIEILIDGEPTALHRAEQYDRDAHAAGYGDGYHGFTFVARKGQLVDRSVIEARLANIASPVGEPIELAEQISAPLPVRQPGHVEWVGGVRLTGLAFNGADPTHNPIVRVFEDNLLIAEHEPQRWAPHRKPGDPVDAARFHLHLPLEFADGRMHVLSVKDDSDREFDGSPLTIQAFDDGLRRHLRDASEPIEDDARAAWFDRFLPMSIPFESYEEWKRRFPHVAPTPEERQTVRVVFVGADGAEDAAQRLMAQSHDGWLAACVPSPDGVMFDWADLKAALAADAADGSVVVFAASDCVLHLHALDALANAFAANPDAAAAYTDIELRNASGSVQPIFFGAFDYERMLEQGYAAHCFAVRAEKIVVPRGERKGSLARLFLALLDKAGPAEGANIAHVPGIFATVPAPGKAAQEALTAATVSHLAKRRVAAQVAACSGSTFPALHVRRKTGKALVSIVIPTRERVDLLRACIGSIRARTKRIDYEIVIVDNDSIADATHDFFDACRRRGDRIVPVPGAFNYSHLNNRGVRASRGDFVCLLNNDTEIVDPEWLGELLSRLAEPDAGAAGLLLKWPNGMVQHGGIVLGSNFAASDAFNDCMETDAGYGDLLRVARECSAVTAACLLVRRKDYLALSGFDEIAFPVLFNDVDFCLRLRAAGKRIVFTPHVQLIHHEAATRGDDASPERAGRFRRELAALRQRWGAVLADDPAYSPYLNLDPYPFSALAWPPRPAGARLNRIEAPKYARSV